MRSKVKFSKKISTQKTNLDENINNRTKKQSLQKLSE